MQDYNTYNAYLGNGAQTIFAYSAPIENADIQTIDVSIADVAQEEGLDYAIGVGFVTIFVAPASGAVVHVFRTTNVATPEYDFAHKSVLTHPNLMGNFDQLIWRDQEVNDAKQYVGVGPQGPQGPAGADGESDIPGPQGDKGDTGDTGATGADSTVPGPQGDQGVQGDQGIQGVQGDTGLAGGIAKNLLINGDFSVNQRAGTKTPGVGVYGFDRWKGHASGLEQIVEGLGLFAGAVILSWEGGGTGSIDGGAAAVSPVTGVAIASTNLSVVVPATATNVQLAYGSTVSAFEYVMPAEQLVRCQRYYQSHNNPRLRGVALANGAAGRMGMTLPVKLRALPTISWEGITTLQGYDGTTVAFMPLTPSTSYSTLDSVEFDFTTPGMFAALSGISAYIAAGQPDLNIDAEL